jgi:ferrous iron transport protein B
VYKRTARIDKVLTGRYLAYPAMVALLTLVLFITLRLAGYPSDWLARLFAYIEARLADLFTLIHLPKWASGLLLEGVFRTLGQVVAVMLPPMAIFFPLFALLEDSGYLPRVAYNLDRPFCACGACGKQSLTMCMGLGCNAVGIVGCRIIDSARERKLAILTNSLMPCNGRLPMLVTLISVLCRLTIGHSASWLVALAISFMIILAVLLTLGVTFLLPRTILRGERSAFTIELPPYRRPRFFQTIIHAITDKCTSVLLRAVLVAAPMGAVIWLLASVRVDGISILTHVSEFLDPFGRLFGMDGAIVLAFLLGIPANEIVIPILVVIYSSASSIGSGGGVEHITDLFAANGHSARSVACTAIFALFHFPCSTSLITVYKETKSLRLTLLSFLIPTSVGLAICFLLSCIFRIFI